NGLMIYYKTLGKGDPLVILHGGPGASHDYFLPYLLPLARHNRLVFIDERGSGRSQKVEDPAGYTIENMVEDVEAVRQALGHGKVYEQNRYTAEYMVASWGEGYFPYVYHNRPDPNYDPIANGNISWSLYRQMWGEHGEFIIDGNLRSVEYTGRLGSLKVPTLIVVGDHDECDPSLSEAMRDKIAGS